MTDDPDIRFASSIMDYLFRRLALEYLTYDERAEMEKYNRAQGAGPGGASAAALERFVRQFDKNGDGKIDAAEWIAAREQVVQMLVEAGAGVAAGIRRPESGASSRDCLKGVIRMASAAGAGCRRERLGAHSGSPSRSYWAYGGWDSTACSHSNSVHSRLPRAAHLTSA